MTSPCVTLENITDTLLAKMKLPSNLMLGCSGVLVKIPDIVGYFLGYFSRVSRWMRWPHHSPLAKCVMRIFFGCSQKKMMRVYARGIVAFVSHKHIGRDITIGQDVRHPVCRDATRMRSWVADKVPISGRVLCCSPDPTIIRTSLGNLRPESFHGGNCN